MAGLADTNTVDVVALDAAGQVLALLRHFHIGTKGLASPPQAGHESGAASLATSALRIAGRVIADGS